MDIKASIDDTRKGFEESFASGEFYNRQTQDAEHLERILAFIKVRDGMRILVRMIVIRIDLLMTTCALKRMGILSSIRKENGWIYALSVAFNYPVILRA